MSDDIEYVYAVRIYYDDYDELDPTVFETEDAAQQYMTDLLQPGHPGAEHMEIAPVVYAGGDGL